MDALLPKLDETLGDVERGRVWDEDELWTEIETINRVCSDQGVSGSS